MSVEQTDVVDAIGTDLESGAVVLTIIDHLPWHGNHLDTLKRKLGSYIRFVESGQLVENYPTAKGQPIEIRILVKYRPTDVALHFLEEASRLFLQRDIRLQYGPIPDQGYRPVEDPVVK